MSLSLQIYWNHMEYLYSSHSSWNDSCIVRYKKVPSMYFITGRIVVWENVQTVMVLFVKSITFSPVGRLELSCCVGPRSMDPIIKR